MRLLQKLRNKDGSSLVVVLVAFAVLLITGLSLLTIAAHGHKTTFHYHKKQQAQYTARVVMDTMVKSLANPTLSKDLLKKVAPETGTGIVVTGTGNLTDSNMGSYKVTVNPPVIPAGGGKAVMKVTVLADYQGVLYSLSAYFKAGKGDRMDPMDFLFFNNTSNILKQGTATGNTVFDGKIFEFGSIVHDKITFKRKILITGSATITDCTFEDDLIYTASATFNGTNTFLGNKYTASAIGPDGKPITDIGFDHNIQYDQKAWRSIDYYATFPSNDFYVNGIKFAYSSRVADTTTLPVGATMSGNIITFADGDKLDIVNKTCETSNGDKLDFIDKYTVETAVFTPAPRSSTVSLSGEISTGRYNLNGASSSGVVTINTTAGDVHLYTNGDLTINANLLITGDNNAYFHLKKGSKFVIGAGAVVGQNGKAEHQLFIEGDGVQFELRGGKAQLKGLAYIPNGKFSDVADPGFNKIEGSVTAKEIKITAGNTYAYADFFKTPDADTTIVPTRGTPARYFIYPPLSEDGLKDWVFVKYGK